MGPTYTVEHMSNASSKWTTDHIHAIRRATFCFPAHPRSCARIGQLEPTQTITFSGTNNVTDSNTLLARYISADSGSVTRAAGGRGLITAIKAAHAHP